MHYDALKRIKYSEEMHLIYVYSIYIHAESCIIRLVEIDSSVQKCFGVFLNCIVLENTDFHRRRAEV